ncbi:MAG: chemotaxis protein CheW [Lachnospiraceae bacterium]|nr:chemotaxis protein CheW [Lachnospiraceae bacterium]
MDALNIAKEYDSTQYIVIKIGEEQYGIDIKYVDNILRMQNITRVPHTQPYFKGVINLRGEVVPVMSLRIKMGLEEDVITKNSRIIILKLENNAPVGIVVDEVKEVVSLDERSIDEVSRNSAKSETTFIFGVGKVEEGLISLLDLSTVINEKEIV